MSILCTYLGEEEYKRPEEEQELEKRKVD